MPGYYLFITRLSTGYPPLLAIVSLALFFHGAKVASTVEVDRQTGNGEQDR